MSDDGAPHAALPSTLSADEPAPFTVLNGEATHPLLLVCDHASRRIPRSLGTLGLDPVALRCHLAWDIGAGALTARLAAMLGVTAVCAEYSRLVIDCNRNLLDAGAFLEFGDGVIVRGNRALTPAAKDARARDIYWPYHGAIEREIERLGSAGVPPTVVAVHSFTPVLNGVARPWEIGVLWDADRATAETFLRGFRAAGYFVGDNEPYSGKAPADFTIDHHAEAAALPHVGIEIRQDLIDDDAGVATVSGVMCDLLRRMAGFAVQSANDDTSGFSESNTTSNT